MSTEVFISADCEGNSVSILNVNGNNLPVLTYDTVIVGAGAAGLCAADELYSAGERSVAVLTENARGGTSRCAGSDKQTFYKLTTSGADRDSVRDLAEALFSGGSMNGDIALAIAAGSLYAFYKLVLLGVPFPENEYGEYAGYRTDHDSCRRASSCGPLTSKYMAEALEKSVLEKGIPILDGFYVTDIVVKSGKTLGVLAHCEKLIGPDNPTGSCAIKSKNVVWAVGGPSDIYSESVYPESQGCSFGAPLRAGARAVNLTESQFGLASVGFRWNLSGSYQQAIPRYVSVDESGREHEFLRDYFSDELICALTFKKGYGWPFCAESVPGSSQIDLAVMAEKQKGRKVYLDYTSNPAGFDMKTLCGEAAEYLKNSGAAAETPCERLALLNSQALGLFASHGIALLAEYLEINVCAQHLNGGFDTGIDGESTNTENLYFVGECAGSFGVKRPGGSALLAGQVLAHRAARRIAGSGGKICADEEFLSALLYESSVFSYGKGKLTRDDYLLRRSGYGAMFSDSCAVLRSPEKIVSALEAVKNSLADFTESNAPESPELIIEAEKNRDVLITQAAILAAAEDYISDGGESRGGYLISMLPPDVLAASPVAPKLDIVHSSFVQTTVLDGGEFVSEFLPVRPIPESELWFEKVFSLLSLKRK